MHDTFQSSDGDKLQFALEHDSNVPRFSTFQPSCFTKRRRVVTLIAAMIFLGIAFIVLISVVVSSRQEGITEYSLQPCKHGTYVDDHDACECFAGFSGTQCELDTDECKSNPCQHGTCSEGINKYTCFCETGHYGTNCENNIDECISNPCIHGVCLDGINGYNCSCMQGYTGTSCQEDIDECSAHQGPCVNGICTNGLGTYVCECYIGFNGSNCEQVSSMNKDFWIGPVNKDSVTTFVNYTLASGLHTYKDLRACAEESTDNQFLAVSVNEATGECNALTWDWGSDPQYETGYTYLRKTKTIESFHPSFQITNHFQWLLPGTLGVGGSVDLYITIPSGTSWKNFHIFMLDTTELSFDVYDDDSEVIMVCIFIQQRNGFAFAYFKVWYWRAWHNLDEIKTPLADGKAHKISFVPQADVMQILIDDTKVFEYTHPPGQGTAKQINIDPNIIPVIELHNITFVGV